MGGSISFSTNFSNSRFAFKIINPNLTPKIHKPYQPDYEEEIKIKADIKARLEEKRNYEIEYRRLINLHNQLVSIYKENWFSNITYLSNFDEIRLTPKFSNNADYSYIFRLITQLQEIHPLLSASFDANSFGVNSTQQVYEYWVFYKILHHLTTLGFELDSNDRKGLIQHYINFVSQKKNSNKYSGYIVHATKFDKDNSFNIDLEIGYDIIFRIPDKNKQRQPDFYILIRHKNENHWYFIDAKYKSFSLKNTKDTVSYLDEICDISIQKYISEMSEILSNHPKYKDQNNIICGSYLAISSSTDKDIPLAENNRLFGAYKSIYEIISALEYKSQVSNNSLIKFSLSKAMHKYGAIVLTPQHDRELISLFMLIFEYLESDKSDDSKKNPNLNYCWNCGNRVIRTEVPITGSPHKSFLKPINIFQISDNIENDRTNTSSKEISWVKYYVTCPVCKAFRVDNHCIAKNCHKLIVKHTDGNYHKWDDSVEHNGWAFLCPICGRGVR